MAYLALQAPREGQASHAHVREIIAGLMRRGWQVELFMPSYTQKARKPGLVGRIYEYVVVQFRLWLHFRQVDVLYVRAHPMALPTAVIARLLRVRTVQEVNGPYEELFASHPWTTRFRPLLSWMARSQLLSADLVIAVTPQLREWLAARTTARVEVVGNGANTELFHPRRRSTLSLPGTYVVFFGVLARWQGIDTLLAAVGREEWPRHVSLVVVGDGEERARVEAAAAASPRVRYLGEVRYLDVGGIVAGSLASLIPKNDLGGRSETGLSPLKLFETMASGVPAVVTDFPGQADVVRRFGAGLVVPPENPEALARAVAALALDPDSARAMGARGRAAVVSEHSWERRADETDTVLRTLCGSRQA